MSGGCYGGAAHAWRLTTEGKAFVRALVKDTSDHERPAGLRSSSSRSTQGLPGRLGETAASVVGQAEKQTADDQAGRQEGEGDSRGGERRTERVNRLSRSMSRQMEDPTHCRHRNQLLGEWVW